MSYSLVVVCQNWIRNDLTMDPSNFSWIPDSYLSALESCRRHAKTTQRTYSKTISKRSENYRQIGWKMMVLIVDCPLLMDGEVK